MGGIGAYLRRSRLREDRGSQVVEFAILVPVLLLIVAGMVQFAWVYNTQVTVTQAAREGARLAAICGGSCTTPVVTATQNAAPGLTASNMTVTVQYCAAGGSCTGTAATPAYCPAGATQANGDAQVIVSYPQPLGQPLLSLALTVKGKARMPCGG